MIRFSIGILLMGGGLAALFGVVTGLAGGGAVTALAGFVATLAGLTIGLSAIARKLGNHSGKPPEAT